MAPVETGDAVDDRIRIEAIVTQPHLASPEWLLEAWTPTFRGVKRMLDVALVILPAVLLTISLPLIALAIKLDSSGPVFYRQERVGEGGKTFNIWKFRSMVQDAEKHGAQFATAGDPRITKVGDWMRKNRVDELPQLYNILKGDMSLIGPRPERPHVAAEMCAAVPEFSLRSLVKPGLTGWAQVRGGYANNHTQLISKLEMDLYYIRNASFRLDARILLETMNVVRKRQGM